MIIDPPYEVAKIKLVMPKTKLIIKRRKIKEKVSKRIAIKTCTKDYFQHS